MFPVDTKSILEHNITHTQL